MGYVSPVSAIFTPDDTFHQELDSKRIDDRVERWRIGPGGITREDVIVVGAINIFADSWMLILQLNRSVF